MLNQDQLRVFRTLDPYASPKREICKDLVVKVIALYKSTKQ